jgi:uncharacterized SAM-binding protein YcdF (DUF218 family)
VRVFKPGSRTPLVLLLVLVSGAVGLGAVPASRHYLLRCAGQALVAEDPATQADIIVVSTDSLGAGILEAGQLVAAGHARRVALFARPVNPLQAELMRRGLPHIDLQDYSIQLLHAMGITAIELIPAVVGTVDEGEVLRKWCVAHSIHSVLFVSVADHSRRTRRVLSRALGKNGVRVAVRWARFSQFDPDTWWQTRSGQRVEIVESQKLLVDILRHPF